MLRRLLLVGIFVIIQPGSVEQVAYAALLSILYLAFQVNASPFTDLHDDFLALVCSVGLAMLFVLCILYKLSALTQLTKVQGVMSPELLSDYQLSHVSLSGILWLTCMCAFFILGIIMTRLAAQETKSFLYSRRLLYLETGMTVQIGPPMAGKELELLVSELHPNRGEHYPHVGPFHIFLRYVAQSQHVPS